MTVALTHLPPHQPSHIIALDGYSLNRPRKHLEFVRPEDSTQHGSCTEPMCGRALRGQREARWALLLRPLHPRELPLSDGLDLVVRGVEGYGKGTFFKKWMPTHYFFVVARTLYFHFH